MSMTLQELYREIGEDYEQALKVLRVEKLVDKHIRRFPGNGRISTLSERFSGFLQLTTESCAPVPIVR